MARNATTGDPSEARPQPDVVRRGVPLVAFVVASVAAITDPAGWVELVVLGVAVAMFVLWERRPGLPTPLLVVGVLVPVALAQLSGRLEPAMFLVSLLAFIVAAWEDSPWRAGAVCLAAVGSPVVVAALQPAAQLPATLCAHGRSGGGRPLVSPTAGIGYSESATACDPISSGTLFRLGRHA